MLLAPISWTSTDHIAEGAGEMQLIRVTDGCRDVFNGQLRALEELTRLCDAVVYEEFFRRFAHGTVKDLAEIASIESAEGGYIFHGDVFLIMLLDEIHGLTQIEIAHTLALCAAARCARIDQVIKEQHAVSDQMEGRRCIVPDDMQEHLPQLLCIAGIDRTEHRLIDIQAGDVQQFLDPKPVKLNPGVLPWIVRISVIVINLLGTDEKALTGMQMMIMHLLVDVAGFKRALSGKDEMEEIMVADSGTVTMLRFASFPAVLIQAEVYVAIVGEDLKQHAVTLKSFFLLGHAAIPPSLSEYAKMRPQYHILLE